MQSAIYCLSGRGQRSNRVIKLQSAQGHRAGNATRRLDTNRVGRSSAYVRAAASVLARIAMVCLILLAVPGPFGAVAAQSRVDAAGEVFVAIAPCRILDTAADPAASEGQGSSRKIRIQSTRCGRIVPGYATSYSVTTTTISRDAPESLPQGAGPATERARKISIDSSGYVTVPQSPNHYTAVDLDGYYVAAGTPISPFAATTGTAGHSLQSDAQPEPGSPATNIVHSGTAGDIYLDGGIWAPAGIFMRAASTNPHIIAQTGTADASSSFWVVNGTGTVLLRASSDGALIAPPTSFFDGRTDFFGSPGSYWGYVPIPGNVVHDVTLVNPMDAANSNQTRVTFFNAYTADEVGSPPITKFSARTGGYYSQENVNFHSSFHWHTPNQFHFRATSSVENNKDTFWVKAATSGSSVAQTRADMFVSGRVGIGTAAPMHTLDVSGNMTVGAAYTSLVSVPVNGMLVEGSVGIGVAVPSAKLHVAGNIYATGSITGATVIGAAYQDLAEWVPSKTPIEPGTVVVLSPDANNQVMSSFAPYDTSVAGVVSAQPGVLLGVAGDDKEMIATTGRVRVKVDATNHPIRVGDLLVSSDKPGMAMKSIPLDLGGAAIHRPGTLIGKALEPLSGGEGEILVLLSLQ